MWIINKTYYIIIIDYSLLKVAYNSIVLCYYIRNEKIIH